MPADPTRTRGVGYAADPNGLQEVALVLTSSRALARASRAPAEELRQLARETWEKVRASDALLARPPR